MIFFFRQIYKFIVYSYVNGIFSINTYMRIIFSQTKKWKAALSYQKINLITFYRYGNPFVFFFKFYIEDIFFNKVATQSHTYPVGPYNVANNAVDGDIATCMRTDIIGIHALHKAVWWKVDLGGPRNIHSINILFKSYNGYGEYRLLY